MPVAALLALAAAFVLAAPLVAIIGGELDGDGHPYVGAIGPPEPLFASGVLISPTVLLTAGHVTRRREGLGARVTFDPVVSSSSVWYTGTAHTNPAYDPQSANDPGDLGVVVLDTPVTGITPASLPSEFLLDELGRQELGETMFHVVGYGVPSNGTRKVAQQRFLSLTPEWVRLGLHENGATCAGDSGSPSLVGDSDVIGGITIGGPSGCKNVVWDMRVDTPSARAFLGQYVTLP